MREGKNSKKRKDERKQGKEKRKYIIVAHPRNLLKTALGSY